MTIDEVNNLKSEILFGSSNCSCTSCDTLRCFTKRNVIEKECLCPSCNEPTTCIYSMKNVPVKISIKANPSQESQKTNKQVKVCHSPNRKRSARRNVRDNKSLINIKLVKKNVYIQTHPHDVDDNLMKSRDKEIQSQCQNDDANNTLANLLNKVFANYNNISIQNVIDRIADICTTCSCKVCDCVLSRENNGCDCKPCECVDCKNALMPIFDNNNTNTFTCKNFNSQSFRYENQKFDDDHISIKENGPCDCKPCDCDECRIYNININDNGQLHNIKISMPQKLKKGRFERENSKSSCKSFQCSKCKSTFKTSKNIIVAPVTEYPQFNSCSCSPCDCNNCRQNRLSPSARGVREISTGMLQNLNCKCAQCLNQTCRQTSGSCHCESRNSVINKPFDNNDQNIDIHSALVTKKISKQSCTVSASTDVILGHTEESVKKINYDNYKDTLTCESGNETFASISTSLCRIQNLSATVMNHRRISQCQCSPCECKICDNFKRMKNEQGVWKSEVFRSKCDCDICRCLYCGDLLQFSDIGDSNKIDQISANTCKTNKSTNNGDRSVYLALLNDVYSSNTYGVKGNRYNSHNYLFNDTAIRLQNTSNHLVKYLNENNTPSFHSALSTSRYTRGSENRTALWPENPLRESFKEYFGNYQEDVKNKVIETFLSKIVRTDEISDFYFDVKSPTRTLSSEKEISNIGESLASFAQTLETRSKCTIDNINEADGSTEMSNEIFGDSIVQKKYETTKLESKIRASNELVRESFGKTNLASREHEKKSQNIIVENISKIIKTTDFDINTNDFLNEPQDKEFSLTSDNYLEKRNILFKARLLTCELLKMLYQCQKAHRDFKSVRQTLKNDCDSKPNTDNTIHDKTMESYGAINVSNYDFKYSWTKLATQNIKRESSLQKQDKTKGNSILNKKQIVTGIIENTKVNVYETKSKLNTHHVQIVKNKNSKQMSQSFTNEYTNTHNRLKCTKHLTTIFKNTESKPMSKNSCAELNHLCNNAWKKNKTDETSNYNKIKYIDVNNMVENEFCNKKRYILIKNVVARSKEYKSKINEHLYI